MTPLDEQLHPVRLPHRYWSESFYFSFLDSDGGWGGSARIAFSPNQGCKDGFIIFYFPDGKAGFIRCWERTTDATAAAVTAVQGLEFTCRDPFQRWHLRYAGPVFVFDDPADAGNFYLTTLHALPTRQVDIDLEFATVHAPFDFHDSMTIRLLPPARLLAKLRPGYVFHHFAPGMSKLSQMRIMGGASHYEQAGVITGTITVDGVRHTFRGTGQRDHSWGVRDMRMINNWQWFSCQFGQDMAFNVTRVEILGFAAVGGHAWYQGGCHPLRRLQLTTDYDTSGRWGRRALIRMDVGLDSMIEIESHAIINLPVHVSTEGQSACVHEALARFSWQGRSASGISEYMSQVAA